MLQAMRKYTKSWVSSAFLLLLAASFGIWGIADMFRGSTDTSAFTLGSVQVPVEAFTREYRNALRNNPSTLTPDQSRQFGQAVLDQMTDRTALDIAAVDLGLVASDGRVQREIQSISAFAGVSGSYDHDTMMHMLERIGYTEDEFISRARQDIVREQMTHAVEGGFDLPPAYTAALIAFLNERRAVQYVVLGPNSVPDVAAPSDAVLSAYVKAHPQSFSSPEYRSVSLAYVKLDALAATIAVDDKAVADELKDNPTDYVTPERRTLEQITFKSEADAKAARAAIDGGKTFEAVAEARGLKPADYQLGDVTKADLDPARETAFFALKKDEVSQPVKSTFGWVLMRPTEITEGKTTSNDDIRKLLQKRIAAGKIADLSNAYQDEVAGGADVEQAARKLKMNFIRIPAIDARGLAPDGSKPLDPIDPELMAAIFKADLGEPGDPFSNQAGDLYALDINDSTPPKIKPLDAVRAQATAMWLAEQKENALAVKAKALAARADQEHSLDGVAKAIGSPISNSDALDRGTNTDLFNAAVVRAIFRTKAGTCVAAPTVGGAYVIARVSGVDHPMPPPGDMQFMMASRQFGAQVATDFTQSLAKAVEKKQGLTINRKVIDNALGNSGS